MTKSASDISVSELLFYITVFNPEYEHKAEVENIINYRLKNIYNFNNKEIEILKHIETQKFKKRGKNINNYLFSHNISATQKIEIIYKLYQNNELYKLSLSELSIAINLIIEIEDYYYLRVKRALKKNDINTFNIANNNYTYFEKINDEIIENYIYVAVNNENTSRFRHIYSNNHLLKEEDKNDIKNTLKLKKTIF